MKKILSAVLCLVFALSLAGCAKTYKGTDELIEKAREEIRISEADTTEIQYAGMSAVDNKALAWFVSGNEYQAHCYLPMEVEIKGEDEYNFVKAYKPVEGRVEDIACLSWNGGYAFVINNPDCAAVRITSEDGTYEEAISKGAYPYVFYFPSVPTEYVFLDADGNELK